ncbi:MAG: ATP-binding protein [Gammaproteobacteria bacterium]|nr:ATP-binding protein [Gammaproteobacteria bacterium]
MIDRDISPFLTRLFKQYPFVTVNGPRQSGKTTLCRAAFPQLQYVNLEDPDKRELAISDPRRFLERLNEGAILDEIQRVPNLLSYLQVLADDLRRNSLFILTGSEQFRLSEAITQSLAGRTALLRLLPFSLVERARIGASSRIDDILYSGFYPRIHNEKLEPWQALGDYFESYVERDVRRIGEIRNLANFRRFMRLCAGRVGQLVNLSSLGEDAGVSHTTARNWLSILEASYIIFQLPPFYVNLRKQLVKSSKIYFYDVGLASHLIGIENAGQISTHPLRGQLFENAVVMEILKHRFNRGRKSNLSFFRDSRGMECDLLYEKSNSMVAIEIKSGATVASDWFKSLDRIARLIPEISSKNIVYGGSERQFRQDAEIFPFNGMHEMLEQIREA